MKNLLISAITLFSSFGYSAILCEGANRDFNSRTGYYETPAPAYSIEIQAKYVILSYNDRVVFEAEADSLSHLGLESSLFQTRYNFDPKHGVDYMAYSFGGFDELNSVSLHVSLLGNEETINFPRCKKD